MRSLLVLSPLFFLAAPGWADDSPAQLARQSLAIRQRHCGHCHDGQGATKGDFGFILNSRQLVAEKLIVPGDPEASELLARIREGSMPPENVKQRPSPEEMRILEEWVRHGGPADEAEKNVRLFRSTRDFLDTIRTHLFAQREEDRPFQRYFSLLNLHNSPDVSERALRSYRAALVKLIGSLSREPDAAEPRKLDREGAIFAIDLRRLGWDQKELWQQMLQSYPYGLIHRDSKDAALRALARDVAELGDRACELLYVRADWFVATASRPPLSVLLLDAGGGEKTKRSVALDALRDDSLGPVALLLGRYQRALGLEDVACELGVRDAKAMQEQLRAQPHLHAHGLPVIFQGAALKRQIWRSRGERARTLFQDTAFSLGLGTPYFP